MKQWSVPNRLSESTSPYLLQHADNPVDWYPWGEEAFAEAKRRDVPIFLSVGYSACHWCHVMAHESFEDPEVAHLMNQMFVNIKVDREELPAVDALYMEATQAMTGRGGWPMSVWLDHDRRPWYAGTYFPSKQGTGMPTFTQVLLGLTNTWLNERENVNDSAARIIEVMGERAGLVGGLSVDFTRDSVIDAIVDGVEKLAGEFDPMHGGFGHAPKFPPAMALEFLMRVDALNSINGNPDDPRVLAMYERTLDEMARGGIYDQLGGGFARYSVDSTWTVPHFEKMLYDNAQLLSNYVHAWRLTGSALYERVVRETVEFLMRELRTPEGGFASALDADSLNEDGHMHEGAFYAWTPAQIDAVLSADDAEWVKQLCNVTPNGTFEAGASVLTLHRDPDDANRWATLRQQLFQARNQRSKPGRDDKIVAAWNGLAISALADAGAVFGEPTWVEAAVAAADLLVSVHLGADPVYPARLVRVSRDGVPGLHAIGVLEDQAVVASSFLKLAQVTGDHAWVDLALTLFADIQQHFVQGDALTDTADDVPAVAESLTHRNVDPTDNVTPSGWSATVELAQTLTALTGNPEYFAWVSQYIPPLITLVSSHTRFAGWSAAALTAWVDGPREVAVSSDATDDVKQMLARATAPGMVYAWSNEFALLNDRPVISEDLTAYICRGFVCSAPVTSMDELRTELGILR